MSKFSTGDVVRLKSGGPTMTVKGYHKKMDIKKGMHVESETEVICTWFENNQLNQNIFDEDQLQTE